MNMDCVEYAQRRTELLKVVNETDIAAVEKSINRYLNQRGELDELPLFLVLSGIFDHNEKPKTCFLAGSLVERLLFCDEAFPDNEDGKTFLRRNVTRLEKKETVVEPIVMFFVHAVQRCGNDFTLALDMMYQVSILIAPDDK